MAQDFWEKVRIGDVELWTDAASHPSSMQEEISIYSAQGLEEKSVQLLLPAHPSAFV